MFENLEQGYRYWNVPNNPGHSACHIHLRHSIKTGKIEGNKINPEHFVFHMPLGFCVFTMWVKGVISYRFAYYFPKNDLFFIKFRILTVLSSLGRGTLWSERENRSKTFFSPA